MTRIIRKSPAQRRLTRVRAKLVGTTARPRLCVVRTNQHIYGQVIDDEQGKTLVAVNDIQKSIKNDQATKSDAAKSVAQVLADKLKKAKIDQVVFDRGKSRYHGRVKLIADILREKGIQF